MEFQLTVEQKMIRSIVRDFAAKEIAPSAQERDELARFDRALFDKMAELGLTGIPFPEKDGGIGADDVSYILAIEELSRACASIGVTLSVQTSLVSWPLYVYGTEKQKETYLKALAKGKKIGAFALTETHSGSDAKAMKTTAVLCEEHYRLNGSKVFITSGGIADVYLIFALTASDGKKKEISAFLVDAHSTGFSVGKAERKMGIRSSPTTEIMLDDCQVPKENLLGKAGQGFQIAMKTLDGGRIGIAAQALGIAQAALDAAASYAKSRKQFNKPIAHHQAVAFKLANMATKIEASRLLTYQAAWRKSKGMSYKMEAAQAKLFASDTAMEATTEAVQIFGGYGYSKDYPVERYMRDAKITQIYEGTNEIQRLVISKLLFAD